MTRKPKILVVGSIVIDLIVETEIFPSSGETVIGKAFQTAPGGKGANQAVQAVRLGADVTMVGKVGGDAFGTTLIQSLQSSGVDTQHVSTDESVSSAVGAITLEVKEGESAQNRIIVVPGANMKISNDDVLFLENEIKNYDIVMLQLEISMDAIHTVIEIAHKSNVKIMLNSAPPQPISDELISKLTYISPNEHEVFFLTGIRIRQEGTKANLDDVKRAAEILLDKGAENVIITLGDKGAALINEKEFIYLECNNVGDVLDPTAAGDSFVGAFCYGVSLEWSHEKALDFANKTAAITVTRMGAQPSLPTMDEIEKRY